MSNRFQLFEAQDVLGYAFAAEMCFESSIHFLHAIVEDSLMVLSQCNNYRDAKMTEKNEYLLKTTVIRFIYKMFLLILSTINNLLTQSWAEANVILIPKEDVDLTQIKKL